MSLDYNGTINCDKPISDFCCGTPTVVKCYEMNKNEKILEFQNLLGSIWRNKSFIDKILTVRKLARKYYNQHKNYCINFNMNNVTGGSGRIILYLNYPDCKSPELTRLEDFNKYTYLLRIINLLPSMWGCTDKGHLFPKLLSWKNYTKDNGTPYNKVLPFCSNTSNMPLQPNELLLKNFIDNIKFFNDIFQSFHYSTSYHNERKYYCKIFTIPAFLSKNGKSFKIKLNGDEIRMLECLLLRGKLQYKIGVSKKIPVYSNISV